MTSRFFLTLAILFIASGSIFQAHARQDPATPDTLRWVERSSEDEGRRLYILGITEYQLENYEEAIGYLLAAREKLPPSAGLEFALMDAFFTIDDPINAAYYGKKAVELDPENKWYRLKLAETYRRAGRNQATIDELNKLLEYYPYDVEVLFNLAQVQTLHGKLIDANRTYDRILSITGSDVQVYFQKFRNFRTLGIADSAIVQLERMIEFDPSNIGALQTLSQFYLEQDDTANALATLERALEINPEDDETIVSLADLYIRENNWEQASELITRVISSKNTSAITKVELAQYVFNRMHRDPENEPLRTATETVIQKVVESEPDFGFVFALAAEYYQFAGNDEKLLEMLVETNRLLPENEPAWRQRIQLYLINDEFDKAIETGKLADEVIPDDAIVLFLVANAWLLKKEPENALEWLERASSLPAERSFRSNIFTLLGDTNSQLKNWEKADNAYEQSLRLNPANDIALNNFAYYLSTRSHRLDEALEMSKKALAAEPENAAYLDTKGWIYFKLGDYHKALEFIQASVDTGNASAVVHEHLGDVYERLGDMQNARKWWQKALEMDGTKTHIIEKLSDN